MSEKTENTNVIVEEPAKTQKKGLLARTYDGYQKIIVKVKSTRGGRAVIKIGKATAIGLGLYGTYKMGQKSVKPTTIYIENGVTEEEQPVNEEEPAVKETNEEDIQEEHD